MLAGSSSRSFNEKRSSSRKAGGPAKVCPRSSIRPPIALRPGYSLPIPETEADPTLYEIPAGLVVGECFPQPPIEADIVLRAGRKSKVGNVDRWPVGHDSTAANAGNELSYVSRPRVGDNLPFRFVGKLERLSPRLRGETMQEKSRQKHDVVTPLAQRRHREG